jgi:protein-tyrosine kinase
MDKLAKALKKARGERSASLGTQSYRIGTPAYMTPAPDTVHVLTANAVKVNEHTMEQNCIVAHRTRSKEADKFRLLRTQVLHAMAQSGMRTLGITSPNYGDGKTTIALNLALSIALDLKQTVLLVDIDLRKPNVMDYLGLAAPVGLTDYFANDIPIADCMVRPSFDRLTLLPAGRPLDRSSEMLGSPKIAALAEEMKARYADRLIIYDMPPVLAQDDPLVFLPHVDGVLLVVNEGFTRTSDLKASLRALSGAHVIGTVLNNSQDRMSTGKLGRIMGGAAFNN